LCPYGQYYPYYYGSAYPYYSNGYPISDYVYDYGSTGQYGVNSPIDPNAVSAQPAPGNQMQPPADVEQAGVEGLQYYNEARAAFEQGSYRDALRLAGHSGLDSPQNPKVHELASLALFASGDYRSAATEAHAALAFGTPSSWADLYGYYNDVDKYTDQLRKLEKTVSTTPNSAPAQFLLGYQYLMTGATPEAKEHFAQAAKLTPNDKLAQHILKQLDSGAAVTPPELPKPPAQAQGTEQQPQLPPMPNPPGGQQL
jgi:tetratricopeptide (TPR) repeat protein